MVELEYKYKASSIENIPIPAMCTLSSASQNHILSLLETGHTAGHIEASTGYGISTISRLRSKHLPHLFKSLNGHPSKLSSINIYHAQRFISSGKADTAVDVAKVLRNITNQPLSSQTVCRQLRKSGLRPVVKHKRLLLKLHHC